MGYIKYENDKKGLADLASHNESFRNVGPESVEVINTLTNSHFKVPTGKRGLNMCKAIEDMRNESYQQGRKRTFSEIFHKMAKDSKMTEQELLDYLGVPEADRAAVVAGFDDKQ